MNTWIRPGEEIDSIGPADSKQAVLAELLDKITVLNQRLVSSEGPTATPPGGLKTPIPLREERVLPSPGLEALGLHPDLAVQVVSELAGWGGGWPPESPEAERSRLKEYLERQWRRPLALDHVAQATHVFVGPAGSGKTTCLCKWLAQSFLTEVRAARVWRLHGQTANTAEALMLYCQALGVPVERSWSEEARERTGREERFIDLPGVSCQEERVVADLAQRLEPLGPVRIHLVLNAAYETHLILDQIQAFALLPVSDLIFTHLDEEERWSKLWNCILGRKEPVGFLSAGQNVPGEFHRAEPSLLLPAGWA
jgi:SRP54-type protein, GTPase domain